MVVWKNAPDLSTPLDADHLTQAFDDERASERAYQSSTYGRRNAVGMYAADNGVVGDGVTDDGAALNALLVSAAAFGVPVVLTAASTVLTTVTIATPSGTRLNLNGATIKAAPTLGASVRVITVLNKSNVLIYGGTIDGDKASYAGVTEQRHGIHIAGSTDITLRDMTSRNNKGDGVFVGDQDYGFSTRVTLDRVVCDGNHRQGLSVTGVKSLTATACAFINTSGTAPQCGVDVEPDTDTEPVQGVRFIGCSMTGNTNAGLMLISRPTATVIQGDVSLVDCLLNDNASQGLYLYETQGASIVGGEISGNGNHGVLVGGAANTEDVSLIGVAIRKNGQAGIRTTGPFTNLRLTNLIVADNSDTTALAESGVNISPLSGASTGLTVIGCVSTGAKQWAGIRTNASVTGFTGISNVLTGNGSVPSEYLDATAGRVIVEAGLVSAGSGAVVEAVNVRGYSGANMDLYLAPGTSTGTVRWTNSAGVTQFYISPAGNAYLMDGAILTTPGTVGYKLGYGAADKLGFWGKTPVIQPLAPPADATDLATAIALVNDLKAKLQAVGIVA